MSTAQETELYDAMTAGDWDTVAKLRANADDDEQFKADYEAAYAHYQADHEPPEDERERNTAEQVAGEA